MPQSILEHAWQEQSVWSQVAGRLKRDLERKRLLMLALTVVGAIVSAGSILAGLGSGLGRVLAFVSAASVGAAGIVRGQMGSEAIRSWTRARSVSEAIKSEVYVYLAGAGDGEAALDARIDDIERDADDLLEYKAGVTPKSRNLPAVNDLGSYLQQRISSQIETYYRPQATALRDKLALFKRLSLALSVVGALLAAAAGVWKQKDIAAWVPVVTTVAAALAAHVAAARYEYLLVEYLRTAEELERLRDGRGKAASLSPAELVRQAEHVISVQNEGWMAKLTSPAT